MTVTASLLLDIVTLLLLVLFFVQGIRRGFILTLCSLLAVFLALAGGWFLATHYVQPVQEALEPVILERVLPDEQKEAEEDTQDGLIDPIQAQMAETVREAQIRIITEQVEAISALLARVILFLAGFAGVLAVWLILCRALDLVARLPVLHFVNKVLGGCLGLVKGYIIFLLLRWILCDVLHLIPAEVEEGAYIFSWLSSVQLLSSISFLWQS